MEVLNHAYDFGEDDDFFVRCLLISDLTFQPEPRHLLTYLFIYLFIYCKTPKTSDTWKIAVITLKFEQGGFTIA